MNYYKVTFTIKAEVSPFEQETIETCTTIMTSSFPEAYVLALKDWQDASGFVLKSIEFLGSHYKETEMEIKRRKEWYKKSMK
jgi:hypothetical protein